MAALTIASGGTLDLNNNHVTIGYGTSADPTTTLTAAITAAYHGGAWDQPGLTSSAAKANTAYGIGYKDDTTAHTLLIQYALFGDANLDGRVNALDFNALATNFGAVLSASIPDTMTQMSLPPADVVPEPGVLGFATLAFVLRRRRLSRWTDKKSEPRIVKD